MSKKVLMAACNYWTSPFHVGSHHIAKGFLNLGWQVAFITDPISPLHILAGINNDLKERWHIYHNGGLKDENLFSYIPGALFTPNNKPLLNTTFTSNNWHKFTFPNITHVIKEHGFSDVDLLYIDSVNQHFWLENIKYQKSILRIADYNAGFDKATKLSNQLEEKIAKKVDTVIYTASSLREHVQKLNPKDTLQVLNGVNFKHFANGDNSLPDDLRSISKPIALYVGAVAEWFDYELILQAAKALPDISFVIIGNTKHVTYKFQNAPNIYLLGAKKYTELPKYIHNSSVGLIPFNLDDYPDLVNNINPLKLYEYMACGLPVLSRSWTELRNLNTPAYLYNTISDFIQILPKIIADNTINKKIYTEYAKGQQWESKIQHILSYLKL